MLKLGSYIQILDNSGGKLVKCFHLGFKKTSKQANVVIGDVVKCSIKRYVPLRKVTRKAIVRTLIIFVKKKKLSKDGSCVSFNKNGGVLISDNNGFIGNRLRSRIPFIFKNKKLKSSWIKLRSISRGFI